MADEETFRSFRTDDPYRPSAAPSRPRERTSVNDPLVELARLIGQSDPFVEFGRQARSGQPSYPQRESRDHEMPDPMRHYLRGPGRDEYRSEDYARGAFEARTDAGSSDLHRHDDLRVAPEYQDQDADDYLDRRDDERVRREGQPGGDEADTFDPSDVPLEPHEDEMYDDAPRKRRHGLATALALIGCAVLGTAAAYGYRSYYSHPGSTEAPPVISADNSVPTKIVRPAASDQQSSKAAQDRMANAGKEQVVSKQEEPVTLKELGTQAAPRVVLPAPVTPLQAPPPAAAGSTTPSTPPSASAGGSTEPRKIRTVTIRPDGGDTAGRPVAPPAGRPTTPPAPRAAPGRSGGPISLDPQSPSEPGPPPRRTAAAPAERAPAETATNSTGGFLVQLASQRSESEALSAFRSLQAKFPNELGGRHPVVRRADLGSRGTYYRTNVGPFASAQEANRFCASYKAAGGQCVVPSN
jgi:hypothetical protein